MKPSTPIPHPERLRRSKPWFKMWARHIIYGTTFIELDLAGRGFFWTLLCFACDSMQPGVIGVGWPIACGYTPAQLADLLKCSESEVKDGLAMCVKYKKITIDERGIIRVAKWEVYQSEYDRTRGAPSRE